MSIIDNDMRPLRDAFDPYFEAAHESRRLELSHVRHRVVAHADERRTQRNAGPRSFAPYVAASVLAAAASAAVFVWVGADDDAERPETATPLLGAAWHTVSHAMTADFAPPPGDTPRVVAVTQDVPVHFADGSSITLRPGASAFIEDVPGPGVRLILEEGEAVVSVTARPAPRAQHWVVDAGPFRVDVVGTHFSIAWDPLQERMTLHLHEGHVQVNGPLLEDGRQLGPGERLVVAVAEGRVTQLAPKAAREPSRRKRGAGRAEAAPVAPAPPPKWWSMATAGDHRGAFAEVESSYRQVLRQSTAEQLLRLADTARFAGRPDAAKAALLEFRQRFGAHDQRPTAAFALGRLALEHDRDDEAATRWFETVLRESATGPLHREALGRLVETRQRQGHGAAARKAAQLYLERYPDGPRAEQARRVLQVP